MEVFLAMGEEHNVVFGQRLKVNRATSSTLFPLFMSHETYGGGRECAFSPFDFVPLSKNYIMLFSHCVITKVMGDDENTYFKVFLDVHDHLGEVHLKTTVFIIYYNSCYNNIVKRPFPGTPLGKCFTPSCHRCWTSPRWSWSSGNKFKQLFSASPIIYVTTTFSKYHSLGQPLGKCPTPVCQRGWASP